MLADQPLGSCQPSRPQHCPLLYLITGMMGFEAALELPDDEH